MLQEFTNIDWIMIFMRTIDGQTFRTDHSFILAFRINTHKSWRLLVKMAVIGLNEILERFWENFKIWHKINLLFSYIYRIKEMNILALIRLYFINFSKLCLGFQSSFFSFCKCYRSTTIHAVFWYHKEFVDLVQEICTYSKGIAYLILHTVLNMIKGSNAKNAKLDTS